MHCSWCVFSFWMMIGFLISSLLIIVTGKFIYINIYILNKKLVALNESCEVVDTYRTNKEKFEGIDGFESTAKKISICMPRFTGSNGDIISSFGV